MTLKRNESLVAINQKIVRDLKSAKPPDLSISQFIEHLLELYHHSNESTVYTESDESIYVKTARYNYFHSVCVWGGGVSHFFGSRL
jgi:hypothetical protein